ncbi:hypothetical protein ROZALSC1DRAFT_28978, partial [Rozella allomycis CSF55]
MSVAFFKSRMLNTLGPIISKNTGMTKLGNIEQVTGESVKKKLDIPHIPSIRAIREEYVENVPHDLSYLEKIEHENPYNVKYPKLQPSDTVFCIDLNELKSKQQLLEESVETYQPVPPPPRLEKEKVPEVFKQVISEIVPDISSLDFKQVKFRDLKLEERSKILIECQKRTNIYFPDSALNSIQTLYDVQAHLEFEEPPEPTHGNPLDELFRGQILPPNVKVNLWAGYRTVVDARYVFPTLRSEFVAGSNVKYAQPKNVLPKEPKKYKQHQIHQKPLLESAE